MIDYLYWFDRLLAINSQREAAEYVSSLLADLGKHPIHCCSIDPPDCDCFDRDETCSYWFHDLLSSIRTHFYSLGIPLSVLGELDEIIENCDIDDIRGTPFFVRFPDVNLFIQHVESPSYRGLPGGLFEKMVRLNRVDFCKEILERKLYKNKLISIQHAPLSREMRLLLSDYNVKIHFHQGKAFCFEKMIKELEDYYNDYDYQKLISKTLTKTKFSGTKEKMELLKTKAKHEAFFYVCVYYSYFVEGIENARDYFPK